MKKNRIKAWTQTSALVCAAACGLGFLLAAPNIVGGKAANPPQSAPAPPSPSVSSQSYEGVITDTHCNAKHSAAIGMTASDCTRTCVHAGEHFALVDGDAVYALEGEQASLKKLAGQRVKIVGTLSGNQIAVASVLAE